MRDAPHASAPRVAINTSAPRTRGASSFAETVRGQQYVRFMWNNPLVECLGELPMCIGL
jgi:hypothetical protein